MNTRKTSQLLLILASGSLILCSSFGSAQAAADYVGVKYMSRFSKGYLDDWGTHGFNGKTQYDIVEQNGRRVLHARCDDSASGLVKKEKISLGDTPVLSWSWRVDGIYEGIDETKREGDDYPASIYVAVKTGLTMLSAKAIHYVWSSNQPQGSSWESAYTENVKQVALRSGQNADKGKWYRESRNVQEDFKRYFDLDIEELDSISLMTDCDNTDGQSEAYYGDILLVPDGPAMLGLEETLLH